LSKRGTEFLDFVADPVAANAFWEPTTKGPNFSTYAVFSFETTGIVKL
jgi:hypothetical protein